MKMITVFLYEVPYQQWMWLDISFFVCAGESNLKLQDKSTFKVPLFAFPWNIISLEDLTFSITDHSHRSNPRVPFAWFRAAR